MTDERDEANGFTVLSADVRVGTGAAWGTGLSSMPPEERERFVVILASGSPRPARPVLREGEAAQRSGTDPGTKGRIDRNRGRSTAFAVILGGIGSILLVPRDIGGEGQLMTWLYVGTIIAAVEATFARLLRLLFDRLAPPIAYVAIPILAGAVGILVGWWAVTYTMGGPT